SFDLITKIFTSSFDNPILKQGDDGGVLSISTGDQAASQRVAISTDSHVVTPLFFPGGDIGKLAVCGTVNDVAMMGGNPLYLTTGFILEEGLDLEILRKVIESMRSSAVEAKVQVIAGDTKVVQKGKADGLYINTTGLGLIPDGVNISGHNARPGDVVILSGTIGDHGIAVLAARGELDFEAQLESDVAPLNNLVRAMLDVSKAIHVLRDPTRGGLATSLNEIALQSGVGINIYENAIPVKPAVAAACEMLGFDPLYVANEGKLIAIVANEVAEQILSTLKVHPLGQEAAIIGKITEHAGVHVTLKTTFGTTRMVDMPSGEMLPRIC
ncbi:MAG: hydrogenase expression/formation protein HypE, partial [Anaerolineae bacterium]|nr:hydrogenase expression/formation protein HypE [Anaerolineae bacterium]